MFRGGGCCRDLFLSTAMAALAMGLSLLIGG